MRLSAGSKFVHRGDAETRRVLCGFDSAPLRLRGGVVVSVAMALLIGLLCVSASAEEITVAAAADLQFALREIAHNYEKKTGNTVKLTFGSSGALAAQIQNGAPFDVFFSADLYYAELLVRNGVADGSTLAKYADGVLVLWVDNGVSTTSIDVLRSDEIRKIAIANPQ